MIAFLVCATHGRRLQSLYNPSALVRRVPEPKSRVVSPLRMARVYYPDDEFANNPEAVKTSLLAVPEDAEEVCLMLPKDDYLGECPEEIGGEMELTEMEDDTCCRTQVWLNPDGTVTLGQSEAPPCVEWCGLWQCGQDEFQMTLQRRYTNDLSLELDPDESIFTVTRTYTGFLNLEGSGVEIVSGAIHFYHYEHDADSDLGYFTLTSNAILNAARDESSEAEIYEGDVIDDDLPKNSRLEKLRANPKAEVDIGYLLENDVDGVFEKAVRNSKKGKLL